MKKVFKASLVATTIALAFAANAADVAIDPVLTVTNEAVLTKTAIASSDASVVIYNRQELSAGDKVTLTFPLGTTIPAAADITINKGAATASFSAPAVTAATATVGPKITYELLVGNPLLANSKIEVVMDGTTNAPASSYIPVSGSVVYEARDGFTNAVKDTTGTGTGTPNQAALIVTAAQEIVSLKTPFNGFVERLARATFTAGKGSQVAVLNVREPAATIKAAVLAPAATNDVVVLKADGPLRSVAANGPGLASLTITDGVTPNTVLAAAFTESVVGSGVFDTVTFPANALASASAAAGTDWTISVTPEAAPKTIPLVNFTVTRKVTYQGVAVANHVATVENAAGKFQLDATLVNVPYLPIGYTQFSPTVEISNLGATDAQVSIEAVGKTGTKYGPVVLAKKAAKGAVTSFFEADIFTAFGLAKGSNEKLSISFVIDANEKDITVVPYYREGESRVNVVSDQYKK